MTSDRLTLTQVLLLLAYAVGMSGGQVLFKLAALNSANPPGGGLRIFALLQNVYFVAALALYAALAILWVWILSFTPLSRGYPFVALAFGITPIFGVVLFGEPVTWQLIAGTVVVLLGLALITS